MVDALKTFRRLIRGKAVLSSELTVSELSGGILSIDLNVHIPNEHPTGTEIGTTIHTSPLATIFGSRGGKARAATLTPEQRSEIARKGGKARQEKKAHDVE